MAIAYDASTDGGIANPGTSLTYAHTCTGSDRGLFVSVFGDNQSTDGPGDKITSVTYGGIPLVELGRTFCPADRWVYLFYLPNPASGSNNVVVTASASIAIGSHASSYTGISKGKVDAVKTNSSASWTANTDFPTTLTTGQASCWTVMASKGGTTQVAGAGTTLRKTSNGLGLLDSNAAIATAGTTTLNVQQNSTTFFATVMASFEPIIYSEFTKRVVASLDDVNRGATSFNTNVTDCAFGKPFNSNDTFRDLGVRFTSVTVPLKALIREAFITFAARDTTTQTAVNGLIMGELDDNAAQIASSADWTARVKTTAQVSWSGVPQWLVDGGYQTPDISKIIQEIVNQDVWSSGNAMNVFIHENTSTADAGRVAKSYDSSSTVAPMLTIIYQARPWITGASTLAQAGAASSFYFDGSDAGATDPNAVWTSDANAFDSDIATSANTDQDGSPITKYLMAEGTNAPASGPTISSVRARVRGSDSDDAGGTVTLNASVYTDTLAQVLGTATLLTTLLAGYGSWVTLTVPTGGWTWAKVQALETKLYKTGGSAKVANANIVEIEVLFDSLTVAF